MTNKQGISVYSGIIPTSRTWPMPWYRNLREKHDEDNPITDYEMARFMARIEEISLEDE